MPPQGTAVGASHTADLACRSFTGARGERIGRCPVLLQQIRRGEEEERKENKRKRRKRRKKREKEGFRGVFAICFPTTLSPEKWGLTVYRSEKKSGRLVVFGQSWTKRDN